MDDFDVRYPERPHRATASFASLGRKNSYDSHSVIVIEDSSSEVSYSPMAVPSPTFHPWRSDETSHTSSTKRRKLYEDMEEATRDPLVMGARPDYRTVPYGFDDAMDLSDDSDDIQILGYHDPPSFSSQSDTIHPSFHEDDADSRRRTKSRKRNFRDRIERADSDVEMMNEDADVDVVMSETDEQPTSLYGFKMYPVLYQPPEQGYSADRRRLLTSSAPAPRAASTHDAVQPPDVSFAPGPENEPSRTVFINPAHPWIVIDAASTCFVRFSIGV